MKIKTIYNSTNEIMRIVGKQCGCSFINDDFIAALNAHKDFYNLEMSADKLFSIALNFYILGVCCGKRLDRAERAHREYKTLTEHA